MIRTVEQSAMRKVYLRLLPFAVLTYFFCYLDRINVSFAALTMNKDLGLDAGVYGFAAGAFFWGYCMFEVPEQRHPGEGRRAAVDRAHHDHLGAALRRHRLLPPARQLRCRPLPARRRRGRASSPASCSTSPTGSPTSTARRIVSGFTLALPIAVALGAPISTALLGLDGLLGPAGWQVDVSSPRRCRRC